MKKFIAILLAVLMLFSFAACADKSEGNKPDNSKKETEILEAFYSEYYEGEKSGKLIRDFDGDGITDMIAVTADFYENGYFKDINVRYVKINEDAAREIDLLKIERPEKEYSGEGVTYSYSEDIEFYANDKDYIMFNILSRYEGVSADYRLLKVSADSIEIEKHLYDPGYSSGLGLYFYEDYPENYDTNALFDQEVSYKFGKYDSYKEAIETELGVYGFKWKLWDGTDPDDFVTEKYVVDPTEGAHLIFKNHNEAEPMY